MNVCWLTKEHKSATTSTMVNRIIAVQHISTIYMIYIYIQCNGENYMPPFALSRLTVWLLHVTPTFIRQIW